MEGMHLMQGVGHANGSGHDAPQEAAKGHYVCAVHLVPKHSADWRAQRLRMQGNRFNLAGTMQSTPAADALAPARKSPKDAKCMRARSSLSTAPMNELSACMR